MMLQPGVQQTKSNDDSQHHGFVFACLLFVAVALPPAFSGTYVGFLESSSVRPASFWGLFMESSDESEISKRSLNLWARERWPNGVSSCGWLQGTVWGWDNKFADLILQLGSDWTPIRGSSVGRGEGRAYVWGGHLFPSVVGMDKGTYFQFSDTAIRAVESGFQGGIAQFFRGAVVKWTRVDATVDFFGQSIFPIWSVLSKARYSPWKSHEVLDSRSRGPGGGRTIYFGEIGRGRCGSGVRVYEKGAQLGEPFDILRCEYQARGVLALDLGNWLWANIDEWSKALASWLPKQLDFQNAKGEREVWYVGMMDRLLKLEGFKCSMLRSSSGYAETREWFRRIFPKLMSKHIEAMGHERAWQWVRDIGDVYVPLTPDVIADIAEWRNSASPGLELDDAS